mmetsp:Transcript_20510/g.44855  ORF Transcript_20510/g.44855 Transcript_20510/m.44855 type:complete len:281 (-) Transcript_20510:2068-2910(-)
MWRYCWRLRTTRSGRSSPTSRLVRAMAWRRSLSVPRRVFSSSRMLSSDSTGSSSPCCISAKIISMGLCPGSSACSTSGLSSLMFSMCVIAATVPLVPRSFSSFLYLLRRSFFMKEVLSPSSPGGLAGQVLLKTPAESRLITPEMRACLRLRPGASTPCSCPNTSFSLTSWSCTSTSSCMHRRNISSSREQCSDTFLERFLTITAVGRALVYLLSLRNSAHCWLKLVPITVMGNASMNTLTSMAPAAVILPSTVCGTKSPYPTVMRVTIHHQKLPGMESKV